MAGARWTQAGRRGCSGAQLQGTCQARLYLLGGFELRIDDDVVDIQPVAQRLLALLALRNGALERSFVAFQLWPDTREDRAKANLRSTVWRLRRCSGDLVEASKTHMRLASCVWVDLYDGLDPVDPDTRGSSPAHRRIDATINAELLPDWYDDWLMTERERIRQLGLHALEAHGNELLMTGRTDEAIQLALRATAVEPLRESPHRLVIRCHLAEGNLVEAVRAVRPVRRTDRARVGRLAVGPHVQASTHDGEGRRKRSTEHRRGRTGQGAVLDRRGLIAPRRGGPYG